MEDLLIKELCNLLPYGVICKIRDGLGDLELLSIHYNGKNSLFTFKDPNRTMPLELYLSEFKPYLFPLSSIKDEVFGFPELLRNPSGMEIFIPANQEKCYNFAYHDMDQILSRFRKNFIDFYGFISLGLAIDATGLNIYGFK